MDATNLFFFAAVILFWGVTIYLANWEDATGQRSSALRGLLFVIIGMTLLAGALMLFTANLSEEIRRQSVPPIPDIDVNAALVTFGLTVVGAVISSAMIVSPGARRGLRRILSRHATFNPESSVHMTAVVLSLSLICLTITNFVLSGGVTGMAEMIELAGLSIGELAFQAVLFVVVAFLGVGLAVRRSLPDTLARLGLRLPTRTDLAVGIGAGSAFFLFQGIVGVIWVRLVSPETFAEQTAAADQLIRAVDSLPLVILLALTAGIGEEIFFRGALQPVFGIIPVSLLFMVIHTQYTLTPAAIIIFVVTLGFGGIRARYSTSAAIIAHIIYDLIQLLLVLAFQSFVGS
jgi:uncharacterized protein